VRLCAHRGTLDVLVDSVEWQARPPVTPPPAAMGEGRELFALLRHHADGAEAGASAFLTAAGI